MVCDKDELSKGQFSPQPIAQHACILGFLHLFNFVCTHTLSLLSVIYVNACSLEMDNKYHQQFHVLDKHEPTKNDSHPSIK